MFKRTWKGSRPSAFQSGQPVLGAQNERAWTNPGPLAGHRWTEVGVPDARTITLQNGIC